MKKVFALSLLTASVLMATGCQDESKNVTATQMNVVTSAELTEKPANLVSLEKSIAEQKASITALMTKGLAAKSDDATDKKISEADKAAIEQQQKDLAKQEAEFKKLNTQWQSKLQAYAIGSSISRYVAKTLTRQDELGLNLDRAIILQAFEQGLADKSLTTEEQEKATLTTLDAQLTALAQEKAKKEALANIDAGKKFLAENAKKEGVKVTDSGLQYQVITAADGDKPTAKDVVTVHYTGTLIDGTEFDSSVARKAPATFPLGQVIPGWTEGVQLMSVGEKYKFFIPSELAYGERANPKIPGNSTLIFEVELLSIKPSAPAPTAAK